MDATTLWQGEYIGLLILWVVSSITPGPNNFMLLQGSLKAGYWGCLWHMLGICFGCAVMVFLSFLGMATLIASSTQTMTFIRLLGTAYLLWLSYKMSKMKLAEVMQTTERALAEEKRDSRKTRRFGELPLSFWQAAAFQWMNPKAWLQALAAPTLIAGSMNMPLGKMAGISVGLEFVAFFCISCWALGGHWLRKFSHNPRLLNGVQWGIVGLTLGCAVDLWLE